MQKALVVGDFNDSIRSAQLEPFLYHQKQLRRQLALNVVSVNAKTFADIGEACIRSDADILFLVPAWNEQPDEAERVLEKVRQHHPSRQLIFIDPFAQASSRFFNVLPYVDRFLKRQRYRDVQDYKNSYIGGSMMTDFLATKGGLNFEGWHVGSKVPAGYENRIATGWSLGTAKLMKKTLYNPLFSLFPPAKTIDIFCRLALGDENEKEWYLEYRRGAVKAVQSLESDYRLAVSGEFNHLLVPRRQYFREIKQSRIVISPFGWGETCWRDYEAVFYNSLLVKPSMEHLNVEPNIFVAGETYVPVRWDLADLAETCSYYLAHPEEADRIIRNARRAYEDYFTNNRFVQTIADALSPQRGVERGLERAV
jgi:hypothetical protein